MPHTGCGRTRTGSTGHGSLLSPGYGRIGGILCSTVWITGEVGLVAMSAALRIEPRNVIIRLLASRRSRPRPAPRQELTFAAPLPGQCGAAVESAG